jgi:hypothetical protein
MRARPTPQPDRSNAGQARVRASSTLTLPPIQAADITDASATGIALMTGANAAAARTEMGLDDAANVPVDVSGATGSLMGTGITNLQQLVDWIDANLIP